MIEMTKFNTILLLIFTISACQKLTFGDTTEPEEIKSEIISYSTTNKVIGIKNMTFSSPEKELLSLTFNYDDYDFNLEQCNPFKIIIENANTRNITEHNGVFTLDYNDFYKKFPKYTKITRSTIDVSIDSSPHSSYVLLKNYEKDVSISDFKKYAKILKMNSWLLSSSEQSSYGFVRMNGVFNQSLEKANYFPKLSSSKNWKFTKSKDRDYILFPRSEYNSTLQYLDNSATSSKGITKILNNKNIFAPLEKIKESKISHIGNLNKNLLSKEYISQNTCYSLNEKYCFASKNRIVSRINSENDVFFHHLRSYHVGDCGSDKEPINQLKKLKTINHQIKLNQTKIKKIKSLVLLLKESIILNEARKISLINNRKGLPEGLTVFLDSQAENKIEASIEKDKELLDDNIKLETNLCSEIFILTEEATQIQNKISVTNEFEPSRETENGYRVCIENLEPDLPKVCKNPFKRFQQKHVILELLKKETENNPKLNQCINCLEQITLNMTDHRKLSQKSSWYYSEAHQPKTEFAQLTEMSYKVLEIFKDGLNKTYPLKIELAEENLITGYRNKVVLNLDYQIKR